MIKCISHQLFKKINLNNKIGELFFLKDFAPRISDEEIYRYLEGDLNKEEIEEIVDFFSKKRKFKFLDYYIQ